MLTAYMFLCLYLLLLYINKALCLLFICLFVSLLNAFNVYRLLQYVDSPVLLWSSVPIIS